MAALNPPGPVGDIESAAYRTVNGWRGARQPYYTPHPQQTSAEVHEFRRHLWETGASVEPTPTVAVISGANPRILRGGEREFPQLKRSGERMEVIQEGMDMRLNYPRFCNE